MIVRTICMAECECGMHTTVNFFFIRIERFGWPRPGAFFPGGNLVPEDRQIELRCSALSSAIIIYTNRTERESERSPIHKRGRGTERVRARRTGTVLSIEVCHLAARNFLHSSRIAAADRAVTCAPAWIVDRTVLGALVAVSAQLYSLVIECSRRTTVVSAAAWMRSFFFFYSFVTLLTFTSSRWCASRVQVCRMIYGN